jgi:hypothetical protein
VYGPIAFLGGAAFVIGLAMIVARPAIAALLEVVMDVAYVRRLELEKIGVGVALCGFLLEAPLLWWGFVRRRRLTRAKLKADLRRGLVEKVDGGVRWMPGQGYVAERDERSGPNDMPLIADMAPLPPGPYRFYVLPHSGVVVGAESRGEPYGAWSISSFHARSALWPILYFNELFDSYRLPILAPPHVGDPTELRRALAQSLKFDLEMLEVCRAGASNGSVMVLEGEVWTLDTMSYSVGRDDTGPMRSNHYFVIRDRHVAVPWLATQALVCWLRYRAYLQPKDGTLLAIEPVLPPTMSPSTPAMGGGADQGMP